MINKYITTMGNKTGSRGKYQGQLTLNIASLNYSSLLRSPYQFYSSDDEFKEALGIKFLQIIKQEEGKTQNRKGPNDQPLTHIFQWDFGEIDRYWQVTRYSPVYMETAGVKDKIYLQNRDEFIEEWMKRKDENIGLITKGYEEKKKIIDLKIQKATTQEVVAKLQAQKQNLSKNRMSQHILNMMYFDLFCFEAIIIHLYEKQMNFHREFNKGDLQKLQYSKKYRDHQKRMFAMNYLSDEKKLSQTIKAMAYYDLDILFVQEANQHLVHEIQKRMPNYRICKLIDKQTYEINRSCSNVIFIKNREQFNIRSLIEQNNLFKNNYNKLSLKNSQVKFLSQSDINHMNVGGKTIIQAVGNLILVNYHLASNAEKNKSQLLGVKRELKRIKECFPDCHIICGGDINSDFLSDEETHENFINLGHNKFYVFPTETITSFKMRTPLQVQRNKIVEASKKHMNALKAKDYLISSLPLFDQKVLCLKKDMKNSVEIKDNKNDIFEDHLPKSTPLPTNDHPYDHFFILAKVKVPMPLLKIYDAEYKLKYTPSKLTFQQIRILKQEEERRQRTRIEQNQASSLKEGSQLQIRSNQEEMIL